MAGLIANPEFWRGRRVLLTGHTGFKGSWTAFWLQQLGATVTGVSLAPETDTNLYELLAPWPNLVSHNADITDANPLAELISKADPEIVIHMAAQALVRRSYGDPLECFNSNVMGTATVLNGLRKVSNVRAILVVTSDKAYENQEDGRRLTEADRLGGDDPYSASKAAAEIVTASFARSFFDAENIPLATARAGNVIGGGDFSEDRLVPDIWRAMVSGEPLILRYPKATRPWQHVLDPINGYLLYLEALCQDPTLPRALNFGPELDQSASVAELAENLMHTMGIDTNWRQEHGSIPKEKLLLHLDAGLSRKLIGWRPLLDTQTTIKWTADWYGALGRQNDMRQITFSQLEKFIGGAGNS